MSGDQDQNGSWTLLTAHGRALVAIAHDPDARMRDLAEVIGVTERTVQAIIADLEAAGYVTRTRVGRRNRYSVDLDQPFRHSAQGGYLVGPLLDLLSGHGSDAGLTESDRPRDDADLTRGSVPPGDGTRHGPKNAASDSPRAGAGLSPCDRVGRHVCDQDLDNMQVNTCIIVR